MVTENETTETLPEAREPEPDVTVSDCMMTDAERQEARALALATLASPEVGELNLLAIWGLEQSAENAQLKVGRDESEREIDRLRLALASEQSAGRSQIGRLRTAMAEGATDAVQAWALRDATITIAEGSQGDIGPAAVPMASALLAMHEELKMKRGLLIAVADMIEAERARGSK
jgi:hypothetical protein